MKTTRISPEAAVDAGHEYFLGDVRVQPIVAPADGVDIIVVRFSPGARTYLHRHTVAQVLHVIEGRGFLAGEGEKNPDTVSAGDVVHIPPGEVHWHGAADDNEFVHVSIRPSGDKAEWTKVDPRA